MKIRIKLLIMTVLLIVLFTLSLLSVTMFMVNTSYLETERDLAAADLRRVMGAVSYESEALSKSATDYARWDDTWLYLNGENESYVQDNFTAETMENLGAHERQQRAPDLQEDT